MTLFSRVSGHERRGDIDTLMRELRDVADALARAERKLAAIEDLEGVDTAAISAATMHLRLLCRPSGYAFAEADEPPPAEGDLVEADDELFRVDRLRPSPFPGDPRRCVILVRARDVELAPGEPLDQQ